MAYFGVACSGTLSPPKTCLTQSIPSSLQEATIILFIFWDDFLRYVSPTTGFPSSSPSPPWGTSRSSVFGVQLAYWSVLFVMKGGNWGQIQNWGAPASAVPFWLFPPLSTGCFIHFLKGEFLLLPAGEMLGHGGQQQWKQAAVGRLIHKTHLQRRPLLPAHSWPGLCLQLPLSHCPFLPGPSTYSGKCLICWQLASISQNCPDIYVH